MCENKGVVQLPSGILHVNEVQRGNPLLVHIRNVKWSYTKEIIPDYATQSHCALFVTVKYHHRHPKHITRRIEEVGRNYRFRLLLVLVDDENNLNALQELNKIAFNHDFTLILASSNTECARYLETFKSYENKSSASIQQKEETEFLPRLTKVLTTVRSVNRTDVLTLLDVFGNLTNICSANEQQLVLCPGIGEKKVRRLHQALHQPFEKKAKKPSKAASESKKVDNDVHAIDADAEEGQDASS
jgi:DNA excision repair protein ERCC-1